MHGVPQALMGCDGSTPANCAEGVVLFDSFGNPIDRKPTYRFSVTGITPIAAPTDMLRICGSATKTVRVKRVGTAASAASRWARRTTPPSDRIKFTAFRGDSEGVAPHRRPRNRQRQSCQRGGAAGAVHLIVGVDLDG